MILKMFLATRNKKEQKEQAIAIKCLWITEKFG